MDNDKWVLGVSFDGGVRDLQSIRLASCFEALFYMFSKSPNLAKNIQRLLELLLLFAFKVRPNEAMKVYGLIEPKTWPQPAGRPVRKNLKKKKMNLGLV